MTSLHQRNQKLILMFYFLIQNYLGLNKYYIKLTINILSYKQLYPK